MPDPTPNPNPTPDPNPAPKPDPKDTEIAELKAKLAKYNNPDPTPDPDLTEKARLQREIDNKKANDSKSLEDALRFDMGAEAFLKTNKSLLPKSVEDIFKTANAEKFNSAVEKASAIKSGIVKEFFSVQSNLDLLTPAKKIQLEDYLKLTNTGRQEQASQAYIDIFEPAFEMLKRVKKAEALHGGDRSSSDDALIEKRMARANKHFLREKSQ